VRVSLRRDKVVMTCQLLNRSRWCATHRKMRTEGMPEHMHTAIAEPPAPCPVCNSPRFTRVGVVEDVGIFWCADCDGVFTIPPAAQARDTDHDPPEES
jgi:hypothetical protein